MCTNYRPVTDEERLLAAFGVTLQTADGVAPEAWPGYLAPFIHRPDPSKPKQFEANVGQFGLLPAFVADVSPGKRLHNARSETVHRLPSFRDAWLAGQRCIIPCEWIYEPLWSADKRDGGVPTRHRIQQPGAIPFGIAGIFKWDRDRKDGKEKWFFTMLTINADDHPFFSRFHEPSEEKRCVVMLRPDEYEGWLNCSVADARQYFKPWTGTMEHFPEPLPVRGKKEVVQKKPRGKKAAPQPDDDEEPPEQAGLF